MAIHYKLVPYRLSDQPNVYKALVYPIDTADQETIIEHITRKATTISEADIRGVITVLNDVVEEMLKVGMNITTPLFNIRCSIQGLFDGPTDQFDPKRHRIVAKVSAGRSLRQAVKILPTVKKFKHRPSPQINQYSDFNSGTIDHILTPAGMGRVTGSLLKFDPDDPEQGIFFIGPDKSRVRVEIVGKNDPSELYFVVPDLPAGEYTLEVRTIPRNYTALVEGTLDKTLIVEGEASS
jgi:hypothetical protein